MSVSIRASSQAPMASRQQTPASSAGVQRASQNPFRRSHAPTPTTATDSKARPHSLMGYLPSFSAKPGPSGLRETSKPAAPPAPLARHTSAGSTSAASTTSRQPADPLAPSIRLDPYATGEFKDTEQKRFLGVGPKIYTRAERALKDKLRTQANFNFDEVARLRETVTDLKTQLHEVRTDRDVIRETCTDLEQALAGHKATIKSFESVFHASINEVSDLKEKLRAKEQQLEAIAHIVTPAMALHPAPAPSLGKPALSTHRSFGRQTFGVFDDAVESGPSHKPFAH